MYAFSPSDICANPENFSQKALGTNYYDTFVITFSTNQYLHALNKYGSDKKIAKGYLRQCTR